MFQADKCAEVHREVHLSDVMALSNRTLDFKRCASFGLAGEDGVPQLYEDIIGPFGILAGGDVGDAAVVQFQVDVLGAGMIGVGGVVD